MSNEGKARKRAEEIAVFTEKLFGRVEEMREEEVDALYEEFAGGEDAAKLLYDLASKAAQQYRLKGGQVPLHVQAALDATRQDADLERCKPSKLREIIENVTALFRGPVREISYAYRTKKGFCEKDRQILDDLAEEVKKDWEKDKSS
jgi:hypothetical protein